MTLREAVRYLREEAQFIALIAAAGASLPLAILAAALGMCR